MTEMKTEMQKEKEEEIKNQTITSQPSFCMKVLVARKVEKKEEEKKKDDGIKLFEFNNEA
jgi:hypothetical protein